MESFQRIKLNFYVCTKRQIKGKKYVFILNILQHQLFSAFVAVVSKCCHFDKQLIIAQFHSKKFCSFSKIFFPFPLQLFLAQSLGGHPIVGNDITPEKCIIALESGLTTHYSAHYELSSMSTPSDYNQTTFTSTTTRF